MFFRVYVSSEFHTPVTRSASLKRDSPGEAPIEHGFSGSPGEPRLGYCFFREHNQRDLHTMLLDSFERRGPGATRGPELPNRNWYLVERTVTVLYDL